METTILLKKAKIIDGMFLELEFTQIEPDGDSSVSTDIKGLYRKRIHQDLFNAFHKLRVHLAFLVEIVDVEESDMFDDGSIYDALKFSKFKVTSFTLGGEGEHEGVVITGQKQLLSNKVLNLNSPFTKFEPQKGTYNYKFLHEMYHDVNNCIYEVEQYLQGKHAPNPQLDLFDESKTDIHDTIRKMKENGTDVSFSTNGPE
jgi:hypothetical protein